jgi:hypothetical protein
MLTDALQALWFCIGKIKFESSKKFNHWLVIGYNEAQQTNIRINHIHPVAFRPLIF